MPTLTNGRSVMDRMMCRMPNCSSMLRRLPVTLLCCFSLLQSQLDAVGAVQLQLGATGTSAAAASSSSPLLTGRVPKLAKEIFTLLQQDEWTMTSVTGSHHKFLKGSWSLIVAVHGAGEVSPLLRQLIQQQLILADNYNYDWGAYLKARQSGNVYMRTTRGRTSAATGTSLPAGASTGVPSAPAARGGQPVMEQGGQLLLPHSAGERASAQESARERQERRQAVLQEQLDFAWYLLSQQEYRLANYLLVTYLQKPDSSKARKQNAFLEPVPKLLEVKQPRPQEQGKLLFAYVAVLAAEVRRTEEAVDAEDSGAAEWRNPLRQLHLPLLSDAQLAVKDSYLIESLRGQVLLYGYWILNPLQFAEEYDRKEDGSYGRKEDGSYSCSFRAKVAETTQTDMEERLHFLWTEMQEIANAPTTAPVPGRQLQVGPPSALTSAAAAPSGKKGRRSRSGSSRRSLASRSSTSPDGKLIADHATISGVAAGFQGGSARSQSSGSDVSEGARSGKTTSGRRSSSRRSRSSGRSRSSSSRRRSRRRSSSLPSRLPSQKMTRGEGKRGRDSLGRHHDSAEQSIRQGVESIGLEDGEAVSVLEPEEKKFLLASSLRTSELARKWFGRLVEFLSVLETKRAGESEEDAKNRQRASVLKKVVALFPPGVQGWVEQNSEEKDDCGKSFRSTPNFEVLLGVLSRSLWQDVESCSLERILQLVKILTAVWLSTEDGQNVMAAFEQSLQALLAQLAKRHVEASKGSMSLLGAPLTDARSAGAVAPGPGRAAGPASDGDVLPGLVLYRKSRIRNVLEYSLLSALRASLGMLVLATFSVESMTGFDKLFDTRRAVESVFSQRLKFLIELCAPGAGVGSSEQKGAGAAAGVKISSVIKASALLPRDWLKETGFLHSVPHYEWQAAFANSVADYLQQVPGAFALRKKHWDAVLRPAFDKIALYKQFQQYVLQSEPLAGLLPAWRAGVLGEQNKQAWSRRMDPALASVFSGNRPGSFFLTFGDKLESFYELEKKLVMHKGDQLDSEEVSPEDLKKAWTEGGTGMHPALTFVVKSAFPNKSMPGDDSTLLYPQVLRTNRRFGGLILGPVMRNLVGFETENLAACGERCISDLYFVQLFLHNMVSLYAGGRDVWNHDGGVSADKREILLNPAMTMLFSYGGSFSMRNGELRLNKLTEWRRKPEFQGRPVDPLSWQQEYEARTANPDRELLGNLLSVHVLANLEAGLLYDEFYSKLLLTTMPVRRGSRDISFGSLPLWQGSMIGGSLDKPAGREAWLEVTMFKFVLHQFEAAFWARKLLYPVQESKVETELLRRSGLAAVLASVVQLRQALLVAPIFVGNSANGLAGLTEWNFAYMQQAYVEMRFSPVQANLLLSDPQAREVLADLRASVFLLLLLQNFQEQAQLSNSEVERMKRKFNEEETMQRPHDRAKLLSGAEARDMMEGSARSWQSVSVWIDSKPWTMFKTVLKKLHCEKVLQILARIVERMTTLLVPEDLHKGGSGVVGVEQDPQRSSRLLSSNITPLQLRGAVEAMLREPWHEDDFDSTKFVLEELRTLADFFVENTEDKKGVRFKHQNTSKGGFELLKSFWIRGPGPQGLESLGNTLSAWLFPYKMAFTTALADVDRKPASPRARAGALPVGHVGVTPGSTIGEVVFAREQQQTQLVRDALQPGAEQTGLGHTLLDWLYGPELDNVLAILTAEAKAAMKSVPREEQRGMLARMTDFTARVKAKQAAPPEQALEMPAAVILFLNVVTRVRASKAAPGKASNERTKRAYNFVTSDPECGKLLEEITQRLLPRLTTAADGLLGHLFRGQAPLPPREYNAAELLGAAGASAGVDTREQTRHQSDLFVKHEAQLYDIAKDASDLRKHVLKLLLHFDANVMATYVNPGKMKGKANAHHIERLWPDICEKQTIGDKNINWENIPVKTLSAEDVEGHNFPYAGYGEVVPALEKTVLPWLKAGFPKAFEESKKALEEARVMPGSAASSAPVK
ncbi:unnamed protein product [Amoebophrya sp. A120]|nr:unnamed protein product [Amoebophrya sp. A120]|eukprot:GSA120T00010342001.1